MLDAELKRKHANERLVNAWFEEQQAIADQERAAARVCKARADVSNAEKQIVEAYGLAAEAKPIYIRYGSDKLIVVAPTTCRVEVLLKE